MERVTELYLVQETPAASLQEFYDLVAAYYAGSSVLGPGSVQWLDDLTKMPNLRMLAVVGTQMENIAPLAKLQQLDLWS